MIITKSEPFTKVEIEKLKEIFPEYIKTVIDIENKICSAGMRMHYEGEQLLLHKHSKQSKIWGGGIDLITKEISYNAFINLRNREGNTSNELLAQWLRDAYKELSLYFFKTIL